MAGQSAGIAKAAGEGAGADGLAAGVLVDAAGAGADDVRIEGEADVEGDELTDVEPAAPEAPAAGVRLAVTGAIPVAPTAVAAASTHARASPAA